MILDSEVEVSMQRLLSLLLCLGVAGAADIQSAEFRPADLFQVNKVWTAHLTVAPDQLAAMIPRYSQATRYLPGASRLQGPEGQRNGLSAANGIEFSYVHADLDFGGRVFKDVAVRYKGNGTYRASGNSDKVSLKVHLNEYVKGQKLAGVTTLNFHSGVTDGSMMSEVMAYGVYRDTGIATSRTAYAKVYLNKKYLGLYILTENVDEAYLDERLGNHKGALLKPVTQSLFYDWGEDWSRYNQAYDPKTNLTAAHQQRIFEFAKFLTHASDAELNARLSSYLDFDNFSRYMAAMVWLCNMDSILANGQNFYVYLEPKSQKFMFLPWDQDGSFGGSRMGQDPGMSIYRPWQSGVWFLDRVFRVPELRQMYLARMAEFSKSIFLSEKILKQAGDIAEAIRPAIAEEANWQLEQFNLAVRGESFYGASGNYRLSVKQFAPARTASIVQQLESSR